MTIKKRPVRKLAILTAGLGDVFRHKTMMGLLRYCPEDVVCVVDIAAAGADLAALTGLGVGVPVVASAREAARLGAEYLVIGVATPGGYLPDDVRAQVVEGIKARLGVISGLHEGLKTDPNIASLACRHAVELIDLRRPPLDLELSINTGLAKGTAAVRVLIAGTDANEGKMTTALQLERHLRARRIRARMVATDKDGILIKGRGLPIDSIIADFAAGAVEKLVIDEAKGVDLLLVEGQGALLSPCYSATCMAALHATLPDAMVLCHRVTRAHHRNTKVPIPPLKDYRALYEAVLKPMHPGKVVAISLNTGGLPEDAAMTFIDKAKAETGLPTADPVRQGNDGEAVIADALLARAAAIGKPVKPVSSGAWRAGPTARAVGARG